MKWSPWVIATLVFFNAGWMTFDGARALIVGDYVTPKAGPLAGQLGPWAKVLTAVGLNPRATAIKSLFVIYGVLTLAILTCFLLHLKWAWPALLILAGAGLWYVPVGTILNLVVIILLLVFKP